MSSKWEDLWGLLTNVSKLERDKGVQQWEHVVGHKEDEGAKKGMESQILSFAQKAAVTNEEMAWETKLGFLLAAKIAAGHLGSSDYLVAPALLYLTDSEVRVRLAAGELLGELCKVQGPQVYEKVKDDVLNLIKTNLERDIIENENNGSSSSRGSPEPRSSPVKMTGSKFAENIFHDTAGWKNLETSMECLRRMVEGLGPKFAPFLDQAMIQLIQVSLGHTNRFVRETGYYTLTSFIQTGTLTEKSDAPDSAGKFGPLFADSISLGLADNWSQVRLSASVACRELMMSFSLQSEREEYFPKILPRLCLNRYYMAEGVKLYNQETWKRVFGSEGKSYVEKYLKDVVKYYVECTRADNHAVREAACHCIAELAIKLDKAVLGPFVDQLIQILLECFKDDSWPVRDTACVAAGNFVAQFPTESQDKIPELFPLFLTNLKDPISSVRQGAALAMSSTVRACGDDAMLVKVLDVVKDGLKGLKEQPVESHRYSELESGAANFGVAKKIRDNDAALHENQPMFSCGSLAPKMGRSGCTDGKFQKPSEPWEFADGCVHLFAELTAQNDIHGKLHPLLFLVADACRQRHYTLHLTFIETVLKRLPGIADNLGKRNFKPYLEEFMEPLFYACESENLLARSAGEQTVQFLSGYLGPSILRGRVNNLGQPRYSAALERIMSAEQPMEVGGESGGMSIPVGLNKSSVGGGYSNLGGTPT